MKNEGVQIAFEKSIFYLKKKTITNFLKKEGVHHKKENKYSFTLYYLFAMLYVRLFCQ